MKNIEEVLLEVASIDERAVRFYDKNGYRIVRNLHTMILDNPERIANSGGIYSYIVQRF